MLKIFFYNFKSKLFCFRVCFLRTSLNSFSEFDKNDYTVRFFLRERPLFLKMPTLEDVLSYKGSCDE